VTEKQGETIISQLTGISIILVCMVLILVIGQLGLSSVLYSILGKIR
jgi:hypothetical protein